MYQAQFFTVQIKKNWDLGTRLRPDLEEKLGPGNEAKFKCTGAKAGDRCREVTVVER